MESLQPFLFWVIALTTGACAIMVVATQNIVRAATWLLFTLAGASGIFFLLGADLVGATQLLVYVGGTLVLVVFGVMLTAQGPFISMKSSGAEWAISLIAGLLLLAVLTTGIITEKSVGAPRVKVLVDSPDKKGKQPGLKTPDVTFYAPRDEYDNLLSRARRQTAGKVKASTAPPN